MVNCSPLLPCPAQLRSSFDSAVAGRLCFGDRVQCPVPAAEFQVRHMWCLFQARFLNSEPFVLLSNLTCCVWQVPELSFMVFHILQTCLHLYFKHCLTQSQKPCCSAARQAGRQVRTLTYGHTTGHGTLGEWGVSFPKNKLTERLIMCGVPSAYLKKGGTFTLFNGQCYICPLVTFFFLERGVSVES